MSVRSWRGLSLIESDYIHLLVQQLSTTPVPGISVATGDAAVPAALSLSRAD